MNLEYTCRGESFDSSQVSPHNSVATQATLTVYKIKHNFLQIYYK